MTAYYDKEQAERLAAKGYVMRGIADRWVLVSLPKVKDLEPVEAEDMPHIEAEDLPRPVAVSTPATEEGGWIERRFNRQL